MFGYTPGAAIGTVYISGDHFNTPDYLGSGAYEIEAASERFPARASFTPRIGTESARVRV